MATRLDCTFLYYAVLYYAFTQHEQQWHASPVIEIREFVRMHMLIACIFNMHVHTYVYTHMHISVYMRAGMHTRIHTASVHTYV